MCTCKLWVGCSCPWKYWPWCVAWYPVTWVYDGPNRIQILSTVCIFYDLALHIENMKIQVSEGKDRPDKIYEKGEKGEKIEEYSYLIAYWTLGLC